MSLSGITQKSAVFVSPSPLTPIPISDRFSSSLELNEPDTTQALCKFYLNYIDSNDYENAIYTARSRHPDFKKNYDEAMADSELSESFLHDRVIQYANDVGNEGLCNPTQI